MFLKKLCVLGLFSLSFLTVHGSNSSVDENQLKVIKAKVFQALRSNGSESFFIGLIPFFIQNLYWLDLRDELGLTPLHVAVQKSCYVLVDTFCEHGASINAIDTYGRTPLMLAVRTVEAKHKNNQMRILNRLRSAGARIDTIDNFGRTLFSHATKYAGNRDIIEFLHDEWDINIFEVQEEFRTIDPDDHYSDFIDALYRSNLAKKQQEQQEWQEIIARCDRQAISWRGRSPEILETGFHTTPTDLPETVIRPKAIRPSIVQK
jgi:hypothetical protein